jgi:hypothetical protein
MTKADLIRRTANAHPGWGCTRIAQACDCRDSYVRVVLRQRVGGKSKSDIAYKERFKAEHGIYPNSARNKVRWHTDPEFRAKRYAQRNKRYWADPDYRDSEIQRHRSRYQRIKAEREASHA